ncbi:MAG: ornithine cyclodeaminase [Paracoccaceae bacterium]|nr:ornithine cyclodeaminase [Paracoccaceae bacterium]
MNFASIPFTEAEPLLNWLELTEKLRAGHALPRAQVGDTFLRHADDTLLSRSAWIEGLGLAVKTATIFPGNAGKGKPTVNGGVCLYSPEDGTLQAVIDFHLVTKWKTAADSLLGASILARKDSRKILIVGSGTVAHSLREAYGALFPDAEFLVWSRTAANAEKLAAGDDRVSVATDLESAVGEADIITCATMSTEPIIKGDWLQPGQHLDLIGAYRIDMREADDTAISRARIFCDSRATVLGHIGEIQTPIDNGVIRETDVIADYYDLDSGNFARTSDDEITLFKNGGGAHLDLMTSTYIQEAWAKR